MKQKCSKKAKAGIAGAVALVLVLGVTVPIAASKGLLSRGNAEKYSVAATEPLPDSPLRGKTILFLGSSVTYGSASKGESFVDFLVKRDGITAVKEARSGTTMVDNGDDSYIARMKKMDTSVKADAFICQLSTNDATKNLPLGKVSEGKNLGNFDTGTVAGAMETIILYARETWNCPVIFYTGTRYDSPRYGELVELLHELEHKWDIGVIDLWYNDAMNAVSKRDYRLYMANGIHPTRAGYRDWWLPVMEEYLYGVLSGNAMDD